MSIPNWFYPIVMLWLVAVPGFNASAEHLSSRRSVWMMLIDTLFLLPWILALFLDEPITAWVGLEVIGLVLLFDLLWKKPSAALREAWVKVSISWFLSWLLIGTAAALSGVHPIVENLFYPLPSVDVDRMRPVLAGVLFLLGLCLKWGLPPLQQGVIDLMEVIDGESHRRWALQLRWAIVFAAWQLLPAILGALSPFNQQLFGAVLLLGVFGALLVASVQAGVQRTLSYMGTLVMLPSLLSFLFTDPRLGFENKQTLGIWVLTLLGFLSLGSVYQGWPKTAANEHEVLLWTDPASPCGTAGWIWRLRIWMGWGLISSLGLGALAFARHDWVIGCLLLLVAAGALAAGVKQLGIATWKQQKQGL